MFRDPTAETRNLIDTQELTEMNKLIKFCKDTNSPGEILAQALEQNKNTFEQLRNEHRVRGILV